MGLGFSVIGGQRCGTTWLHSMLHSHNKVWMTPLIDELQFWDTILNDIILGDEIDWNKKSIEQAVLIYKSMFIDRGLLCGDVTPSYCALHIDIIKKINMIYPNLKLIFITRNLVDWAWSQAKLYFINDFDTASEEQILDCIKSQGFFDKGDFDLMYDKWSSVFNNNNILLLNFDTEFIINKKEYIQKVFNFLGLDYFTDIENNLDKKINFVHNRKMSDDMRAKLTEMTQARTERIKTFFDKINYCF